MVGHYWLRDPRRAPSRELTEAIVACQQQIHDFSRAVHAGRITSSTGQRFDKLLVIGIGGSALGPQLVGGSAGERGRQASAVLFRQHRPRRLRSSARQALSQRRRPGHNLGPDRLEVRRHQRDAQRHADRAGGLRPGQADLCQTRGRHHPRRQRASQAATRSGFPGDLSDVGLRGGRTSELSAVGLLPAALQGLAIDELLAAPKPWTKRRARPTRRTIRRC
jgi:glucose-6-phosphate isomerase